MSLRSKPREIEFEKLLERKRERDTSRVREEERKKSKMRQDKVFRGRGFFANENFPFFQTFSLIRKSPFSSFHIQRETERERDRKTKRLRVLKSVLNTIVLTFSLLVLLSSSAH